MKKILFLFLVFLTFKGAWAQTPTPVPTCCGVLWTQKGGNVTFNHPRGLQVIGNELFVADPDNNLVQVFGLDGTFHRALSMPSPGRPLDLATDNAGNLYVACDSGQEVLVLNPATGAEVISPLSDGNYYRGVAVDPNTRTVFASSAADDKIHWFKPVSGSYVTQTPFGTPPFTGGAVPTGMLKTGSSLYVANNTGNSIVQFTGNDSAGYSYIQQVTGTSGPTSVTDPYEIKMDASGRFYVPSYGGSEFTIFNPDWSLSTTCKNAGFGLTYGIAVDANDNVYLSSDLGPEQVVGTNPCDSPVLNPSPPGDGFIYPSPARGSQATVSYNMAEPGRADLRVWNEKAELVTHVTDTKPAGVQTTPFSIAGFGSGVYFYALTLNYDSGKTEKLITKKFAIIH